MMYYRHEKQGLATVVQELLRAQNLVYVFSTRLRGPLKQWDSWHLLSGRLAESVLASFSGASSTTSIQPL